MLNYRQDLQIALRERYRRIFKAKANTVGSELGYFVAWVKKTPSLCAILEAARATAGDFDPAAWGDANVSHQGFNWPPSEAERAVYIWFLVERWAETADGGSAFGVMHPFADSGERNGNAIVRQAVENAVEPLINYLEEHVGAASDTLHLLARFKHRVEWFDHDALLAEFEAATSKGESVYDTALRRFLFDNGVDYPFSQPDSPSGIADVVAAIDTDDPLVCELKLFDQGRYGASYLAKGVTQAVAYAHDYSKDSVYLVVVNLSQKPVQLPTDDGERTWPPRLHVAGVVVNIIMIAGRHPDASASKRGKADPIVISRDELVEG